MKRFDEIDVILITFLTMVPLSILGVWKLVEIVVWLAYLLLKGGL